MVQGNCRHKKINIISQIQIPKTHDIVSNNSIILFFSLWEFWFLSEIVKKKRKIWREVSVPEQEEVVLGHWMIFMKLQYFGHLMWRTDSLEKTMMFGKIEGSRRRGWQRIRWYHQLDEHEFEQAPGVGDREAWHAAVHGVAKSQTLIELNWTNECSLNHFVGESSQFRMIRRNAYYKILVYLIWELINHCYLYTK